MEKKSKENKRQKKKGTKQTVFEKSFKTRVKVKWVPDVRVMKTMSLDGSKILKLQNRENFVYQRRRCAALERRENEPLVKVTLGCL